jgi:hypothetical protein
MRRIPLAVLAAALLLVPSATASAKLRFFSSPTKTIGCVYASLDGDRSIRCDLENVDHPKPKPSSCDLEFGHAFALGTSGRARRLCHGDTVLGHKARVLDYGDATRFGPFTCKVGRTRGMRCTSRTGHGFQLSRARQKLW